MLTFGQHFLLFKSKHKDVNVFFSCKLFLLFSPLQSILVVQGSLESNLDTGGYVGKIAKYIYFNISMFIGHQ